MKHAVTKVVAAGTLGLLLLPASAALADSGFFVGGSVGNTTLEVDVFDESDFAWKGFVGYNFDLPLIDLGVEAGYVDFGKPSMTLMDETIELDPSGWNLWGTVGLDLGPLGVYAKVGYLSWDVEIRELGETFSDDGSDVGYGVGAKIGIGPVQLRGEFESYDIEDADKLDMLSVGLVWQFD
jgi:outer membrane immunogenic protein